jgi:hypothetical protein
LQLSKGPRHQAGKWLREAAASHAERRKDPVLHDVDEGFADCVGQASCSIITPPPEY